MAAITVENMFNWELSAVSQVKMTLSLSIFISFFKTINVNPRMSFFYNIDIKR